MLNNVFGISFPLEILSSEEIIQNPCHLYLRLRLVFNAMILSLTTNVIVVIVDSVNSLSSLNMSTR